MEKVGVYDDVNLIQLLSDEEGGHMYSESPATISFFGGKPPLKAIREQFKRVVTANKWLAGKLVTAKGGVRLYIPDEIDIDKMLVEPGSVRRQHLRFQSRPRLHFP